MGNVKYVNILYLHTLNTGNIKIISRIFQAKQTVNFIHFHP